MSVELEGRMNEMCNVSDYWEEIALQTGRKEGREEGRKEGREEGKAYNIPINVDTIKEGYPILCA